VTFSRASLEGFRFLPAVVLGMVGRAFGRPAIPERRVCVFSGGFGPLRAPGRRSGQRGWGSENHYWYEEQEGGSLNGR
jgi:hypothetical protein